MADGHQAAEELPARAGDDFWAVHLLSGFQGAPSTDLEPDGESSSEAVKGIASESHHGALIYAETLRDGWQNRPERIRWTVLHELGHLTGPDHGDEGVMEPEGWIDHFEAESIDKIRDKGW